MDEENELVEISVFKPAEIFLHVCQIGVKNLDRIGHFGVPNFWKASKDFLLSLSLLFLLELLEHLGTGLFADIFEFLLLLDALDLTILVPLFIFGKDSCLVLKL